MLLAMQSLRLFGIETHMATLGRNRLKSILSLAAQKIEEQRRADYRHEQQFFNQG